MKLEEVLKILDGDIEIIDDNRYVYIGAIKDIGNNPTVPSDIYTRTVDNIKIDTDDWKPVFAIYLLPVIG